jgi:hypothetical protein
MSGSSPIREQKRQRLIFALALRISLRVMMLVLCTTLAETAFAQTRERRVVRNYPADSVAVENLQLWVDAGHDTWCRNSEFVAASVLRRITPEMEGEYELASSSLEKEKESTMRALYVYHSLDGQITYRIFVRRNPWIKVAAGTPHKAVWIPERAEIVSKPTMD